MSPPTATRRFAGPSPMLGDAPSVSRGVATSRHRRTRSEARFIDSSCERRGAGGRSIRNRTAPWHYGAVTGRNQLGTGHGGMPWVGTPHPAGLLRAAVVRRGRMLTPHQSRRAIEARGPVRIVQAALDHTVRLVGRMNETAVADVDPRVRGPP